MENLSKVLSTTRPTVSGYLNKYTNVMKGYQMRFCKVDAENGILSYFLSESSDETNNIPRGQVQLVGALINPSDEDSKTFSINCASGEVIKLKANDAKGRQEWVDALRAVVESLSSQSRSTRKEMIATHDCLMASRKQLQDMETCNAELSRLIENSKAPLNHNDPDLLMLKALSAATTSTLSQAFGYLQRYHDSTRNEMY